MLSRASRLLPSPMAGQLRNMCVFHVKRLRQRATLLCDGEGSRSMVDSFAPRAVARFFVAQADSRAMRGGFSWLSRFGPSVEASVGGSASAPAEEGRGRGFHVKRTRSSDRNGQGPRVYARRPADETKGDWAIVHRIQHQLQVRVKAESVFHVKRRSSIGTRQMGKPCSSMRTTDLRSNEASGASSRVHSCRYRRYGRQKVPGWGQASAWQAALS